MVEKIYDGECLLGIIVRDNFSTDGITFFTSNDTPLQLAFMKHPLGNNIKPHVHNEVRREIFTTNEVLVIKKGKLRVDFYSVNKEYLESRLLNKGDVVLLISGGHSFYMIDEVEMFEIKQGPYVGDFEKTRFEMIKSDEIKLISNG